MCYFISMSNINWNQFTNNFFSNLNKVAPNNVQNNQITPQAQTPIKEPYIAQPYLQQSATQIAQTTAELALLNQQQNINMLKDLLQLPKNFEQLLVQLNTNPKQTNQKIALLLIASTLNVGKLSDLLQTNSKQAMTNLYQMMAQLNQVKMSLKDEQLTQITKLISFVAASSTSDVQTIRTTMLMYLPWLPLTDPNSFKLEIANDGSNGGQNSDDSVTVLIQTINYGNIQADIYKTNQDGIRMEIITSEAFPQNELSALMQDESKKYNININVDLAKKEAFNKEKNENTQTQVCMNTSPGVNPFLLLISNALIKGVHTIDEKESLREIRKEKLE